MDKQKVIADEETKNYHVNDADEPLGEAAVDNGEGADPYCAQPATEHKEAQGETINPSELQAKNVNPFLASSGRDEKSSARQRPQARGAGPRYPSHISPLLCLYDTVSAVTVLHKQLLTCALQLNKHAACVASSITLIPAILPSRRRHGVRLGRRVLQRGGENIATCLSLVHHGLFTYPQSFEPIGADQDGGGVHDWNPLGSHRLHSRPQS